MRLESLVQPIGGPMSQVVQPPTHPGEPSFPIFSSMLGDVNQVLNPYSNLAELGAERAQRGGRGARARPRPIRAIAEGLERYSSCVFDERQFIWATAEELGDEALDLDTVPRQPRRAGAPALPVARPEQAGADPLGARRLASTRGPSGSRGHGLPQASPC